MKANTAVIGVPKSYLDDGNLEFGKTYEVWIREVPMMEQEKENGESEGIYTPAIRSNRQSFIYPSAGLAVDCVGGLLILTFYDTQGVLCADLLRGTFYPLAKEVLA